MRISHKYTRSRTYRHTVAVAVMTQLAMWVVSCYWLIQLEKLCNCHQATCVSHAASSLSDSRLSILERILLLLTLSMWWCLSYCNSMFSCTWGVWLNSEVNLCSKACQKSCITTKCHALWAKLNHKNNHIFVMSYRCSSYSNSRIWQIVLMLNVTVNMQLVTYFTKGQMFVKTS